MATSLLVATPLLASSLQVQNTNRNSGTWATRLTVSRTCTAGNETIADGPLSSDPAEEPCGELTANNVDVIAPGPVRFKAGESVRLGNGFSVTSGVSFVVEVGAGVLGDAVVRDQTPQALKNYHVRFYVDPDNLMLLDDQQFDHLVAYDAQGNREFLIGLTYDLGTDQRRLYMTAFENDGSALTTKSFCPLALGSGWQYVEAHWQASTGIDGDLEISVNGGALQSLASCLSMFDGLANDSGEISAIEWGVRNPPPNGSAGSMDMDDFTSTQIGPIGAI